MHKTCANSEHCLIGAGCERAYACRLVPLEPEPPDTSPEEPELMEASMLECALLEPAELSTLSGAALLPDPPSDMASEACAAPHNRILFYGPAKEASWPNVVSTACSTRAAPSARRH